MVNDRRFVLQREGDLWTASAPGLLDPSEAPIGRGASAQAAVDDLQRQPEIQAWLREHAHDNLTLDDFTLDPAAAPQAGGFVDAAGKRHRTNPATDT
jgi:hypothetical protein